MKYVAMSAKHSLIYLAILSYCGMASAVPYNIARNPIGVGQGVEPNVVFIMDDSGSMDFEVMTRDFNNNLLLTGTQPDGSNVAGNSLKHRDSDDDGVAECDLNDGNFYGYFYGVEFGTTSYTDNGDDCNTADDEEWRFRNSDFNLMYFDPNSDYLPWIGVDQAGNDFTDIAITNAYDDPYTKAETIDLTRDNSNWVSGGVRLQSNRDSDGLPDGFRFYTWSDKDNDGNFDDGEETEYQIGKVTQAEIDAAGWTNPDGTVKTVAQLQQDFANWFTYWRSRDLVAKGALGSSIAVLNNMRIGYTTINTTANNFALKEMNPNFDSGEKRNLLSTLYGTPIPGAGTPLRNALMGVGDYYECVTNRFNGGGSVGSANCPVELDEGQCRQNYTIMMTDGFYNGSNFDLHGNDNKDGDDNSAFDGGDFADNEGNTLADIAMHYYERDLHPTLTNSVPATFQDSALSRYVAGVPSIQKNDPMHQHMKTYTMSFGVEGSLDWATVPPATWPSTGSNAGKVDDLIHAAFNGRGDYYSANDAQALQESIAAAFRNIAENVGSLTNLAFSSGSVEGDTAVYAATYNMQDNSGTLIAYPFDCEVFAGNQRCEVDVGSPLWNAAELLTNNPSSRKIVTYDPVARTGIPFQASSLNATQLAMLNTPLPVGLPAAFGSDIADERVSYLRGDRTYEGDGGDGWDPGEFRERSSLLGDIVNSSPYYVGAPFKDQLEIRDRAPWPQTSLYSSFHSDSTVKNRMRVVYVGANDGMLHGFNSDNGEEVFAYVPSFLFPNLVDLTDPGYQHRMYVDHSPNAVDVFTNGAWRTVLIGGVGAGGRGIYALDVTRPSTNGFGAEATVAANVMWEFTNTDDADLGHTYTQPVVAMTNVDGAGGEKQWVAIIGNGVNSTSADGDSAIFLLKMEGPNGVGGWTGQYIKLSTGFGMAESEDGSTPNGIFEVRAVDIDINGTVDYVYAGDLQGRLHRFDLTATTWSGLGQANNVVTIFRALDAAGNPQPITVRPAVVNLADSKIRKHAIPGDMDVILVFGTGSWFREEDGTSLDDHTIYGIADDWSRNNYSVSFPRPAAGDLVRQSFSEHSSKTYDGPLGEKTYEVVSAMNNNMIDYSTKKGWYMDIQDSPNPYPGERAIGRYEVSTRISDIVATTTSLLPLKGTCGLTGEAPFNYAIDAINGGRPEESFFDLNADGNFDNKDSKDGESAGIVIKTRSEGGSGSGGTPPGPGYTTCIGSHCYTGMGFDYLKQDREARERTGRLSWQEIQ